MCWQQVMKKILWVTPDFPFPPNHGGRFDIHRRLLEASGQGFEIHLLSTVKARPSPADLEQAARFVSSVQVVDRSWRFADGFKLLPYQVIDRSSLSNIDLDPSYDLVILESEYVAPLLKNRSSRFGKVALRVHNNECVYYRGLARSVGLGFRKIYYLYEMLAFGRFSDRVKKQVDALWYISREEAVSDSARYPGAMHVPTPFSPVRPAERRENDDFSERRVLFIGSLFMVNNIEGLRWYLDQVHPGLLDIEGYSLVVAGNCAGVSEEVLKALEATPRVQLYRSPRDLGDIYAASSVFINPMLNGAGVKLKTLNAVEYGLPVVSTTTGLEGLDLRDDLDVSRADDAEDFGGKVRRLLMNPGQAVAMAASAQLHCSSTSRFLPRVVDLLDGQ